MAPELTYTTFARDEHVVTGDLRTMLQATKARLDGAPSEPLLTLEDDTGRPVDFDLSGSVQDVVERYLPDGRARGPGRPKLGVVAREVTLLPRHWDWLAAQPAGASATLRRLVEEARKNEKPRDRARRAAATAGKAMTTLAGDRQNFEEAYRALDAGKRQPFEELTAEWPEDVRAYLLRLAELAFDEDARAD